MTLLHGYHFSALLKCLLLHPEGHPGRIESYAGLGLALRVRYDQIGGVALLDEAIALHRKALASCPVGHRNRAASCANLALSIRSRFEQIGDNSLLKEAIAFQHEALVLRPTGHVDHATACGSLASSLWMNYMIVGDMALLDKAIQLQREALALRPVGSPHRAASCRELALSFTWRYIRTGPVALLDEAIVLYRECLSLLLEGHPDRAATCAYFAQSLVRSYEQCGATALLNEAIDLQREAIRLRPDGHHDHPPFCADLSVSLLRRYQQTGEIAVLDESIKLDRKAFAAFPEGNPQHAEACYRLAQLLTARYGLTGDANDLDEIIALQREALALRQGSDPLRSTACSSLGSSLVNRFQQTGNAASLYEAITLHREALVLKPINHPWRPVSCVKLAFALELRYGQSKNNNFLNEAIKLKREALALCPAGHAYHSMCCSNLARALMIHYHSSRNIDFLDEAITLQREAAGVHPAGHPMRALVYADLMTALSLHNAHSGNPMMIDEALKLSVEALTHCPTSGVWRVYASMCRIQLQRNDITKALRYLHRCCCQADLDDMKEYMEYVYACLSQFWSCADQQAPIRLVSIYSKFIDRLPLMAGFVLDTSSRLSALRSFSQVGYDACIASVLARDAPRAIELLDHAHGIIWAQVLHQRDPQLEGVPQNLASELERLLRTIAMPMVTNQMEPTRPRERFLTLEDVRHKQNSRIQAILHEIRGMPGSERFMQGITFETLRQVAKEHPVVMLVSARGHAFALIIPDGAEKSPHTLRLDLTSEDLVSWSEGVAQAGFRSGADASIAEEDVRLGMKVNGSAKPKSGPLTVLESLWHKIVKPVLDHLQLQVAIGRSRPRLHWCPTGEFAFLPLHAAGIYDGHAVDQNMCCSDFVVSSYTPTISALLRAQAKAALVAAASVDVLLIGEDCASDPSMNRLWSVRDELEYIETTAKSRQLGRTIDTLSGTATIERVTDRIRSANFVHLACHGIQDRSDALESGFHLRNGRLTVSKLMELDLDKAWFAYLSACETAKGDACQPDQAIHLAAAMMFAGFKSVVATMWSIADEDGPDMAQWFYEELMLEDSIDADSVAYALDAAVQKLRAKVYPTSPKRWAPFIHMGA